MDVIHLRAQHWCFELFELAGEVRLERSPGRAKPPERLNYNTILQPEIRTTTNMSTSTTSSDTTTVTNTMAGNSGQSALRSDSNDRDGKIQSMFAQLMNEARSSKAERTKDKEELMNRFDQCLERWQIVDTRLVKLEDDQARLEAYAVQQNKVGGNNTARIAVLEDDVISIRNDMARFAAQHRTPNISDKLQLPAQTSSSSTLLPPETSISFQPFNGGNILTSSTMNPLCNPATLNTTSQGHSSFFGSQERLQDAVSEFSGNNRSLHPENFVRQLDIYFENVPMSEIQQLISAQRRLSGDARIWYDSLIPTPTSYIEFRSLFRQRFWFSATQRKSRNEVFRPFQYTRYDGLATHAMQWIAGAKYLSPPIDPIDLVSTIIQHYPTPLSMALRGRGPRNTNELLAVLTEFEESTSFCEPRREDNRPRPNAQQNHPNERRVYDNRQGYREGYNRGHQQMNQPVHPAEAPVHQVNVSGNEQTPRP